MTALDVVLVVARVLVGCWLVWSLPRLRTTTGPPDRSGVSVIIPARDEAAQLPSLLASLPADVETIVVDDQSSDATAAVAAAHGATVVPSAPLPDGWTGKSWACTQGATRAGGDRLVFVDADVRFAPDGLDRVVATLARNGGLVSVQPFHEPGSLVERLAALFNIVAVAGSDTASPTGRRFGVRGAFGPVLATGRLDYDATGGHGRTPGSVVEDIALADAYRASGRSVSVYGGASDVAFRMYPDGFGALVEGFAKNLTAGAGSVRRSTVALVVAWVTLLVQAAAAPVVALLAGEGGPTMAAAVVLYAVVGAQFWWMARRIGRFGVGTALCFPVHTAVFLAVFVRSIVAARRGAVTWRGRQVPTRDPGPDR